MSGIYLKNGYVLHGIFGTVYRPANYCPTTKYQQQKPVTDGKEIRSGDWTKCGGCRSARHAVGAITELGSSY
ncbi:hypothetical protein PSPTOT1_2668 [Pseudomonas syringae pv. tomato T1]|nr:hypothetical protein PSPTOT1_2668 [Pseudomonas syringae pv. tomato T1]